MMSPSDGQPCDCFIFRKEGAAVHRLTFFRIHPTNAAPALYMYLDGLNETMGYGRVAYGWFQADPHEAQVPLGFTPPDLLEAKEINYSFFTQKRSGTKWLSHAHLFRLRDGSTFIVVYSSTEVTSPETLERVYSRFDLEGGRFEKKTARRLKKHAVTAIRPSCF